ncbi:MAG: hypothetical protein WA936_13130 [Erythrobacter sp.]
MSLERLSAGVGLVVAQCGNPAGEASIRSYRVRLAGNSREAGFASKSASGTR